MQVVRLNGPGTVCAYVVNSQVAWGEKRDQLCLSIFNANVVADSEDQFSIDHSDLRQIPILFTGERQLPTGDGLPSPSQPSIGGLEPDLPHILQEDESNYRGSGFSKADLIMADAYDDFPELFEKQKKIKK